MVHIDDPSRAVLACLDIVEVFRRLELVGRCGVTTGRNYCGVVGSARRMEYTVLGDTVNLSARLMANAAALAAAAGPPRRRRGGVPVEADEQLPRRQLRAHGHRGLGGQAAGGAGPGPHGEGVQR